MAVIRFSRLLSFALLLAILSRHDCTLAADPSVEVLLEQFSKDWPDNRTPYRTEGDTTWITYATTLGQLVAMGEDALPGLTAASRSPSFQVRALCARSLGLIGNKSATPTLIKLLADKKPVVALLAADSLGQLQDPAGLEALRAARQKLSDGDVLLHISKALDRDVPREKEASEQVVQITSQTVNTAEIGKLAPDFTLQDSSGKEWRLSDFRGEKSVVLVFIYGDG